MQLRFPLPEFGEGVRGWGRNKTIVRIKCHPLVRLASNRVQPQEAL